MTTKTTTRKPARTATKPKAPPKPKPLHLAISSYASLITTLAQRPLAYVWNEREIVAFGDLLRSAIESAGRTGNDLTIPIAPDRADVLLGLIETWRESGTWHPPRLASFIAGLADLE